MGALSSHPVTPLLRDASEGKQGAADALFPIVCAELRFAASAQITLLRARLGCMEPVCAWWTRKSAFRTAPIVWGLRRRAGAGFWRIILSRGPHRKGAVANTRFGSMTDEGKGRGAT
jgi:hypothetical protein